MPPSPFLSKFMEMLCQLYRWLGGECKHLSSEPGPAILAVTAFYDEVGPPSFDSPAQRLSFLTLLAEIEALLLSIDNPLGPVDTQNMLDLINQICGDIL